MNFISWFKNKHPEIPVFSAEAVIGLSEAGATIPFIARYRKEQTGNLNEVAIEKSLEAKEEWDEILKRQAFILKEIESQKKLTDELKVKISGTFQLNELEDIYFPYRAKKRTKAEAAREAGLQPLAEWLWNCGHGLQKPLEGQTLKLWAFTFRNDEKNIKTEDDAIQGAISIVVEKLSEDPELRKKVRDQYFSNGFVISEKGEKAKPNSKFEKYFESKEKITDLLISQNSHRYLALKRGLAEQELNLSLGGGDESFEAPLLLAFREKVCTQEDFDGKEALYQAADIAFKVHVTSSIEREVHKELKRVAEEAAINVFAQNLRTLLLAPPFGSKNILAVDPGIRTGCKVVYINEKGGLEENSVFFLNSDEEKEKTKQFLKDFFSRKTVDAIGIGNGTNGRETEVFIRKALKELAISVPIVLVNESGASVYSASETAREEFPDLDVTVRGAISIGRRFQDPLSELVKIDPKSIGVGQYQHDVNPHRMKKNLDLTVEYCVNQVGVDLNTASYHLLSKVSGIGENLSKAIVNFRLSTGLFQSRADLLKVPGVSQKTFEQAAGFLRVRESENPLDNTGVHPERYGLLENFAKKNNKTVKELIGAGVSFLKSDAEFKEQVGPFTYQDILTELEKPGRDPRKAFKAVLFREDAFDLTDLKVGMVCPGIVTNVTNFGAFVDIGVHQDGLVHLSNLSYQFVKDPKDVVKPGEAVMTKILDINLEKKQIALTMKLAPQDKQQTQAAKPAPPKRDSGPRRPPKPQFKNNPFAVLSTLKK